MPPDLPAAVAPPSMVHQVVVEAYPQPPAASLLTQAAIPAPATDAPPLPSTTLDGNRVENRDRSVIPNTLPPNHPGASIPSTSGESRSTASIPLEATAVSGWHNGAVPAPTALQGEQATLEPGSRPEADLGTVDPGQGNGTTQLPASPSYPPDLAPVPDPERPLAPAPLRLLADTQTFSPERQWVTASGDVLLQFGDTQLAADRLWVNLNHRYLRAEGNVFFNRNQQILEGDTATYNLLQGSGRMTNGRGSLRLSTLAEDFAPTFPNDVASSTIDYRLQEQGSISQVTSPGGLSFALSPNATIFGGESSAPGQWRFETSQIDFDANGWYGNNVRLTNDPFSPPELELRGNRVSFVPISAEEDELCVDNPRLVFDQGLSIPLVRRCYLLRQGQLPPDTFNPLVVSIGYDNRDRDGLFIGRDFTVAQAGDFRVTVAPQIYLSRWLQEGDGLLDFDNFGVVVRGQGRLDPRTSASGFLSVPGLDLQNFGNRARANLRVQRLVGTHRLGVEYTYRDRLFNGSLGFQDVQTSAGVLLESPLIPLGQSGINLSYQLSGQYVTANTDRAALLDPGVSLGLTSLMRLQGSVNLSRSFILWQGEAQPSTATEALRYSPRPVVPFLALNTGLRGVATYYTSNNLQESLDAGVGLVGQMGHLTRSYFDYTQFNLGLSSSFIGEESSPFLFDRMVDQNTLSGGVVQQIYGPILLGVQTSFNLDTGRSIDTSFSLEYRRRTHGLFAQYSPTQQTGLLGFRISQFNWVGQPDRFDSEGSNQNVQVQ